MNPDVVKHLLSASPKPVMVTDCEEIIASQALLDLIDQPLNDYQQLSICSLNDPNETINQQIFDKSAASGRWTGIIRLNIGGVFSNPLPLNVTYFKTDAENQERTWLLEFEHLNVENHKPHNLTHYDEITGLPNSYLFKDRIDQAILSAPRQNKSLALFIIKIDQLNMIYEAYDVKFGNILLKLISDRLKACVRLSDTIAKYEDDQFAMVLQISSTDDSVLVAKKIIRAFRDDYIVDSHPITVYPRIGISLWPIDGKEAGELITLANTALLQTKVNAGGSYTYYSEEFNSRAKRRIDLENRLKNAISHGDFVLFYQPKVRATDHRIIGMEGLIRWIDPENGMISPGEFIPLAEETGLICDIGEWVLREGCMQSKRWIEAGFPPTKLSLNVSSRQLSESNFVEKVKGIIESTGIPPELLELEITESLLMSSIDDAIAQLNELRSLGCKIAIDDFGTGYSSLSYLTRIPIDTVKIDRSFIQHIESDNAMLEVTKVIISLSKSLKLEVVAEGAEKSEHVAILSNYQCDAIQGFYFSKPLPAEKFKELLEVGYIVGQAFMSRSA